MIFLDTSFFVAFCLEEDDRHEEAVRIRKELFAGKFGHAYTSEYVFDETLTLLLHLTKDLQKTIKFGELLGKSAEILPVGSGAFSMSWTIFKQQRSTKFSFTDCTIINTLNSARIGNIATFDREFKTLRGIKVID
ncbi:MAG: type II toxin-antitoxin system VapC family toxin [Candidatus Micrarchaeota archaeon]|nr:type II toxin-antitoxin system VapC family toxin [Candidatus Micrarchaeota archaeon]